MIHDSLFLSSLLLVTGVFMLSKGADVFIENASKMAQQRGVSPHVIGVTLVAFATSLPEALVSLNAAYQGYNDLALGNIVGSNMSNIGFVLPISIFLCIYVHKKPISTSKSMFSDGLVMLGVAFLLYGVSYDGLVSKFEGILFLVLYFVYILSLLRRPSSETNVELSSSKSSFILGFSGLIVMLLGAQATVEGAIGIAVWAKVPPLIVGLSVVAIGTSLPELAGSWAAVKRGEHEIAVGNIIGSNIANILLVLAVVAIVKPIEVETSILDQTLPLLLLTTIITVMLIRNKLGALTSSILSILFLYFLYTSVYLSL